LQDKNNMIISRIYTTLSFLILTTAAFAQPDLRQIKLKERYRDFFTIGAAITPMALRSEELHLIESQFSGITAENAMKMGPIHPQPFRFNWGPADSLLAFATRSHLRMRGHTLVWHSQTPKWLFEGEDGKQVNKEILLQRIHDHIDSVVDLCMGCGKRSHQ